MIDALRLRRKLTEREASSPAETCRQFRTQLMLDETSTRTTAGGALSAPGHPARVPAVEDIFIEITDALEARLYLLALMAALSIPDMCAALDAENGETSRLKYVAWFDAHVHGMPHVDGDDCYGFRCSLLHQGRFRPHRGEFDRIAFIEPRPGLGSLHMTASRQPGEAILIIDVDRFCLHLVAAGRAWLEEVRGTERFIRNAAQFVCRSPNGIPRHVTGVPVIS